MNVANSMLCPLLLPKRLQDELAIISIAIDRMAITLFIEILKFIYLVINQVCVRLFLSEGCGLLSMAR